MRLDTVKQVTFFIDQKYMFGPLGGARVQLNKHSFVIIESYMGFIFVYCHIVVVVMVLNF